MTVSLAPDDIVRTRAEAAANAREPLIVLEPLTQQLAAHGLEVAEDLAATPIGDGHSNVTFELSTGVVLRRPPRGPLPPSAHDVLREARLLRALESTPVRVPEVLDGVRRPHRDRGAVLRDGARRRRGDHGRDPGRARQSRAALSRSPTS